MNVSGGACLEGVTLTAAVGGLEPDLYSFLKYLAPLPSFPKDLWPIVSTPRRLTCLLYPSTSTQVYDTLEQLHIANPHTHPRV